MLCIWADQKGVLYYTLLKPSETIYEDRCGQRLSKLKRGIAEKRPQFTTLIFLHDNTRPHIARPVKNYLKNSGWEVLSHPPPNLFTTYPFSLTVIPVDAKCPFWNTVHIRTVCWNRLNTFEARAVLLRWNPQITRKIRICYRFWSVILFS